MPYLDKLLESIAMFVAIVVILYYANSMRSAIIAQNAKTCEPKTLENTNE
jgi:hypothetical protein